MITVPAWLSTHSKKKLQKLMYADDEWKDSTLEAFLAHWIREHLREVSLETLFAEAINKATVKGLAPIWFENFVMNVALGKMFNVEEWMSHMEAQKEKEYAKMKREHYQPMISQELKESESITHIPKRKGKPSLIVAAGPSIRTHNHIPMLAKRGWDGVVIACDRQIGPLIEAGVTPDNGFDLMVAGVDGNRVIIPEWFEDEKGKPYDLEGVPALFCSTVAPQTIVAAEKAGAKPYYFHGSMDAFHAEDSVTGAMNWMMQFPAVQSGGNVGATTFTLSLYLWCNPVVFIGLDLGYRLDTPVEETAYYDRFVVIDDEGEEQKKIPMAEIMKIFNEGYNPDIGVGYKQDPIFRKYSRALIDMIEYRDFEAKTRKGQPGIYSTEIYNCTEGGSIHHPTLIKCRKFSEVLDLYGRN